MKRVNGNKFSRLSLFLPTLRLSFDVVESVNASHLIWILEPPTVEMLRRANHKDIVKKSGKLKCIVMKRVPSQVKEMAG